MSAQYGYFHRPGNTNQIMAFQNLDVRHLRGRRLNGYWWLKDPQLQLLRTIEFTDSTGSTWTVPAGFMELGESLAQGAARETLEEACAEVEIGHLFASVDVVHAGQVHLFFTARLLGDYAAGAESLEVAMYSEEEIPWDDLAFQSGRFALQKYFEDCGQNNGVHFHELRRAKS